MSTITSEILQQLMRDNNIANANQLANLIKGNRSTLGNIINGASNPNKNTLEALSVFFRVPKDYLITGNKIYLEENTVAKEVLSTELNNKEAQTEPLKPGELDRFIDILYLHKDKYENLPMYKEFEKTIKQNAVNEYIINSIKNKLKKN